MSTVHEDIEDVTQMTNKQKLNSFRFNQENVD